MNSFCLAFIRADSGNLFKGRNGWNLGVAGEYDCQGIGMVHQHFSLEKKNDVAGQCDAGIKGRHLGADREVGKGKTDGLLAYGLPVNPEAPVHTLSVGEQQRGGGFSGALYRDVSLLILDEPTGVLTPQKRRIFSGY